MDETPAPYRKPGERRPLTDSERRWFTKKGDVEKGPYELSVLARSIKSGVLKRTSLVRAEDETEWQPVYGVPALMATVNAPTAAGWTHDARSDDVRVGADEANAGSFGLGFAGGFFGGIIGLILIRSMAKGGQTKSGAVAGFITGLAIGLLVRLAAMGH